MNPTKGRRRPRNTVGKTEPLEQRLQSERERLFRALSIIACCRLACASLLAQGGDLEVIPDALQAAYDLVDETAGALEGMGTKGNTGF